MINFHSFLSKEVCLALLQRLSLLCSLLFLEQRDEEGTEEQGWGAEPGAQSREPGTARGLCQTESWGCTNTQGCLCPAPARKQMFCRDSGREAGAVQWF